MHHYSAPGRVDRAASGPFRASGNNEKLVGVCANCDMFKTHPSTKKTSLFGFCVVTSRLPVHPTNSITVISVPSPLLAKSPLLLTNFASQPTSLVYTPFSMSHSLNPIPILLTFTLMLHPTPLNSIPIPFLPTSRIHSTPSSTATRSAIVMNTLFTGRTFQLTKIYGFRSRTSRRPRTSSSNDSIAVIRARRAPTSSSSSKTSPFQTLILLTIFYPLLLYRSRLRPLPCPLLVRAPRRPYARTSARRMCRPHRPRLALVACLVLPPGSTLSSHLESVAPLALKRGMM